MNGSGTARVSAQHQTISLGVHPDPPPSRTSSGRTLPFSNLSIRYRLPVLIGVILALVIVASTWAGYRSVRQSAINVGSERLRNLTEQLASLSQQSAAQQLTKSASVANDPIVTTFLTKPSAESREAVSKLLQQFESTRDPNSILVELRNPDRSIVYSVPDDTRFNAFDIQAELTESGAEAGKVVGPIRMLGDAAVYPVVAAAKDAGGKIVGYLVRWRRISASPQGKQQLAGLLGSEAGLYLGNVEGDIWTDLVQKVPKPPVGLQSTLELVQYKRNDISVMALGRPIRGTPWFVMVEFPDTVFLNQSTQFLWRMASIGLILLLLGMLSAFLISESITRPLRSLTESAAAISGGDYSHSVPIRQKDELGILAESFNDMVVKVRLSQSELEQKVQERTSQLEQANKELEAFSHLTSQDLRAKSDELAAMTQQLWQASKLATMGELAASIAHELNNPLATVALHVESLVNQLAEDDDKRRSLEVILQESERMATLVNDLLQFSRRSYRQLSTVDIREEIVNTIEFIRYYLRNRKIEVVQEFDAELPTVQADRQQLRQMFLNLMTNASDAMPEGGRLTIRVAASTLNNSEAVKVEFIDTGEGLSQEQAARVWEPFFTTKPAGKGTGLGLAICRRLTEEHSGKITFVSEVGKGTTVSIVMPATANGEESVAAGDVVALVE
jgi:signal transduction histidine kinase